MRDGNKKYGRNNFKKGMSQEVILDSLLRHIKDLMSGEVMVPDSEHGATHWDAIVSNALMLSELRPSKVLTPDDFDSLGYNASGFGRDGWHRTHEPQNDFCNCPSCR